MNFYPTSNDFGIGYEGMQLNYQSEVMYQQQLMFEANLSMLLDQYCMSSHENQYSSAIDISTCQSASKDISYEVSSDKLKNTDDKLIKKRKRRNFLPNLDSDLMKILQQARNGDLKDLFSEKKLMKSQINKSSRRSSQFIGVSKNGDNWQSLINHGHSKKYIGTYSTEIEAAIAYDFFAIALQGSKSRLNFRYNCEILVEMINSYYEDERTFIPNKFISKLL